MGLFNSSKVPRAEINFDLPDGRDIAALWQELPGRDNEGACEFLLSPEVGVFIQSFAAV